MFLNIFTIASILTTLNAYYIKNDITCVPNKVIPHPTDCGRFIKCGYTDNTNIILNCTYPTLFNRRILDCDRPQNVFCQTYNFVPREENLIETIPKNEPEKVYCPRGCLFPHPTDCNRFIQCGETLKDNKEFRCPTSMLYNHLITGCDLAQNVICITYNYIFISDDKFENQNQILIEEKPQAVGNATNNAITSESELLASTGIMKTKETPKTEPITTEESNVNFLTTELLTPMESILETTSTQILTTEEITMESQTTEVLTTEESNINVLTTEPLTPMESILETTSTQIFTTEEITMESQTTEILTTEPLTPMESILETTSTQILTTEEITMETQTTEILTTEEITMESQTTEILTTEEITMESQTTEVLTTEPLTPMESILETTSTQILTTEEITMESQTTEILTTEETDGETTDDISTLEVFTPTSEPFPDDSLTIETLTTMENQVEAIFSTLDSNLDMNETQSFFDENFKNFNDTSLIVSNSLSNISRIEMIDRFNNTIEVNYIITNESDSNLLISETSPPQTDITGSIVKNYFFNYLGKISKFFIL